MKITEPINLAKEQPESRPSESGNFPFAKARSSGINFEQCFNNLEKQCTGDEYYWQHQDQLQQSNLHFDPKMPIPRERKELVLSPEDLPEKLLQHISEKNANSSKHCTAEALQATNNLTVNCKQLSPIFTKLKPDLNQLTGGIIESQQSITTKQPQTAINTKSTDYSPCFKPEFKTHHLFIHGNEVELSLNTTTLKPQEHKTLRQMINNHLKEKGLILNTLIINGVPHDRTY